jgi:S1-C subfamily serine protease
VRNGRDQNIQVTLAELPDRPRPDTEESSSNNGGGPGVNNSRFGLRLQPLTPDAASRYGLDASDQGLLVSQVDPSGSAASAGIRQGDLIQEVNRQPVRTFAEFSSAIQQSGARPALVLVKRRDAVIYVTLRAATS